MNKNIDIFYKFAKEHKPDFYQFIDGTAGYCTDTRCIACTLNYSCKLAPTLTEDEFNHIKETHPEYMI
jgi:hypothetical protein